MYEGSTCECGVHVVSIILYTMYVNNIHFVTLCHFIVTSYKYSTKNTWIHYINVNIYIILLYKLSPFDPPDTPEPVLL